MSIFKFDMMEMGKMKKTIASMGTIIALFIGLTFLLYGCTSEEAKHVSSLIDNIGEVTIDSKSDIDEALKAYNMLNDNDKKDVKNIDDLYAAQKEFEQYIPEYIDNTIEDYEYSDSINYEELVSFVNEFYDELDEEQIEVVGCAIGKCQIEDLAVSEIKDKMANPSSFELVDFDTIYIHANDSDDYTAYVKITYRGSNAFGGIVGDISSGMVDFSVDFNTCSIVGKSSTWM